MSAYSSEKPGRGRVYDSIIDTIGNTPIVRLDKLANAEGRQGEICLPSSSSSIRSPRSRTASASP
jgi:cysteine synthase